MARDSITSLTERQKECLRLVARGHETKEVARLLGKSPSAIVERLRAARTTLGVGTSREAAVLLARAEGSPTYMRHVDMPGAVADPPAPDILATPGDEPTHLKLEEGQAAYTAGPDPARGADRSPIGYLVGLFDGLSIRQHVAVAIAAVLLFVIALLGSASLLETVTKLHRTHPGLSR